MKQDTLEPRFVEYVPADLEQGALYVSMEYAVTVHLCACGCGNKVTLPLSPAEWQLYFDGEAVSLSPSIGNWQFPCKSHYFVKANRIKWAAQWDKRQIEAVYERDAADFDALLASRQNAKDDDRAARVGDRRQASLLGRMAGWLRRLRR